MSDEGKERFIADAMLGRLARWLRLLGYDTLYSPSFTDNEVRKLALREDRTILTRDREFMKVRNAGNVCLIRSNDPREQLMEVFTAFPFDTALPGRCARCNGELRPVRDKEAVRSSVPDHVFRLTVRFSSCGECGRIYWEGTHLRNFRDMLRELGAGAAKG